MAKSPAPSPQMLGHYALRKKLGAGAMGQVWLAHDKLLDREVAIKVLHAGMSNKRLIQDFLREAQAAAKLNHPNTVTIYQIDKQGGQVFIAMEYVEAGSLSDELRDKGALPWREATQAIRDAAAGLQAAHERGMVHRDIKPSNLMRSARGLVKVVDFGLAKARTADAEATQTQAGTILGSPAYMSPEQCRGERADARSDLYSLICSYYHLLTRKTPFAASEMTAAMYQHCHEPFPDIRATGIKVPDGVCRILEKGSVKKPEFRYQSAAELIADLDVVLHAPEVSHTFDGPGRVSKAATTLPARSVSISSILKGKGLSGKAVWALVIALAAGAIIFALGHRAGAPGTNGQPTVVPVSAKPPTAIAPPAASPVVDVLRLIDPAKDAVLGSWRLAGGQLTADRSVGAHIILKLPYTPADDEEYDLHLRFSYRTGTGTGAHVLLSHAGKRFNLMLDQNGTYGLENVFGKDAKHNVTAGQAPDRLAVGVPHDVLILVRRASIEVRLDGKPIIQRQTDYSEMDESEHFNRPYKSLGLGSWNGGVDFETIDVTEISGHGAVGETSATVSGAIPSESMDRTSRTDATGHRIVDLMPFIDAKADALRGSWTMVNGKLRDAHSEKTLLRLPYLPGDSEEYDFHVGFVLRHGGQTVYGLATHGESRFSALANGAYGLENVDGKNAYKNSTSHNSTEHLSQDVQHDFVIRVRASQVDVCLDGRRVINYTGGYDKLSENENWKRPDGALGIGAGWGDVDYGPIEVVEVKGTGTLLRSPIRTTSPGTSLPTGEDPRRRTPGLVRAMATSGNIESAQIAPGGRRLCIRTSGLVPHDAALVDVETGMKIFSQDANVIELLPGGKRLLADWPLWWAVYDVETGKRLYSVGEGKSRGGDFLAGGSTLLGFLTDDPDDPILYDLNTGAKIREFKDHATERPRAMSADGKTFAAAGPDRALHVWDAETGHELWHVGITDEKWLQLTFSADGKRLLRQPRANGRAVDLFDARTGELLAQCGGWSGRCNDAALSADGKLLAVVAYDGTADGLRLFKLEGDEKRLTATVKEWHPGAKEIGPVNVVAFSPDSGRVLVGCRNGKVRLFEVNNGHELNEFDHGGEVLQVSISSDGHLAVSGNDTSIRVWRLP